MTLQNLILVVSAAVTFVSAINVPLTMLTDPKAKCLDGTQAGYYAQAAPNPSDKNKWVIYLYGGGECDTEWACTSQTAGAVGSSKYFPNVTDATGWFLGSDYCTYNPTFCGWNHVADPYCSQDLHAGQRTEATDETWGLYFSGHHIFTATLDAMDKFTNSLLDATEIILQGVSAGGIGVWMNVDYLAKRYPNAKVTAMTVAGHYFYATYYDGPNHTNPGGMADFRQAAFDANYKLYDAFVDESCKEAYEAKGQSAGACMASNNSLPFIDVDSFVVQSQTDQTVLTGHDCWPESYMHDAEEQAFMTQWHNNMTVALEPLMKVDAQECAVSDADKKDCGYAGINENQCEAQGCCWSPAGENSKVPWCYSRGATTEKKHGVFAVACYTHTSFNHAGPLLNGQNYQQVFSTFYLNSSSVAPETYKLSDDCGLMCNPTCL
eukprot:gene25065-31475_t